MTNTQLKKLMSAAVLAIGLLGAGNANAATAVYDAIKNLYDIAYKKAEDAWREAKDEWEASEWAKQWTQLKDTIKGIQDTIDSVNQVRKKITSEITGVMSAITNIDSSMESQWASSPEKKVDYKYAQRNPGELISSVNCPEGSDCTVSGDGYTGVATVVSSFTLRDNLKVDPAKVGNVLLTPGAKSIDRIAREAAEKNAQELAVINAMAYEAYTQASNRVATIEILKSRLKPTSEGGSGPDGEANTLKYIADLQARIQYEQTLLINDQNRLSALAVLQQSQRDMYEQRKKEIATYVKTGDREAGAEQTTIRGLIAGATATAYTYMQNEMYAID